MKIIMDGYLTIGLMPLNQQAILFLREYRDGAAFGCLVGDRRELGGIRQILNLDTEGWNKFGCHPVAERDRAGLVEE